MLRLLSSLSLGLSLLIAGCTHQLTAGGAVHAVGYGAPAAAPMPASATAAIHVDVSFYGISLAGADDVVFVLDRSGSMGLTSAGTSGKSLGLSKTESILTSVGGTLANHAAGNPLPSKLEAAKSELLRTLAAMPDGTRVGIVFFDTKVATPSPALITLTAQSRRQLASFVRDVEPGGSTAARPAMNAAFHMGARHIVLLSDGLANSGGNGASVLATAQPHMQSGVRIDTVGVGLEQDDNLLQALAHRSGGTAVMR